MNPSHLLADVKETISIPICITEMYRTMRIIGDYIEHEGLFISVNLNMTDGPKTKRKTITFFFTVWR